MRSAHGLTLTQSIVVVGTAFFILRKLVIPFGAFPTDLSIGVIGLSGLTNSSKEVIEMAYDVLGLEALFLVPRIFSLLSLNPYFGTLVSKCVLLRGNSAMCPELHWCEATVDPEVSAPDICGTSGPSR